MRPLRQCKNHPDTIVVFGLLLLRPPCMLRAMTQTDGHEQGSRWRWLFRHRPALNAMIPPDARVDPDRFPEEEFPLYCPACDYLLRGLPGNRCPECGQAFDRGRLLVEQYVIQQDARNWPRATKYAKRTIVASLVLTLAGPMCGAVLVRAMNHLAAPPVGIIAPVVAGCMILGLLLGMVSICLCVYLTIVGKGKPRVVFQAIDQGSVSYQQAQRLMRFVRVGVLALAFAFFGWYVVCRDDWYIVRHYARHPAYLWPPIGLAVGVGAVIWGIHALVTWFSRRHGWDKR